MPSDLLDRAIFEPYDRAVLLWIEPKPQLTPVSSFRAFSQ
jgi:hypothetical protein